MIVHGKEVHFLLTVGATQKISKLCPEGDIKNIGLIFETMDTSKMIDTIGKMAAAMSDAYAKRQKYIDSDYIPAFLTEEEVMTFTIPELEALQNELMNEIGVGMETSVTAEPEKIKGKKNEKVIQ